MSDSDAAGVTGGPWRRRAVVVSHAARIGWRTLVGLVYPRSCLACGVPIPSYESGDICSKCAAQIEYIGSDRCAKCGFPFGPYVGEVREPCPKCRPGLFFRKAVAVWRYDGPGREIIVRWKYGASFVAERLLVARLVELLQTEDFAPKLQIAVGVPMHWRRLVIRRFNQAERLAAGAARGLGIPYGRRVLVRIRNTPSQVGLPGIERIRNVRGAFRVRRVNAVRGKAVLLVDDVVTTCATVSECSRALRRAGARAVFVASIAR